MRPSQALYSALAPAYREHFEVPHRRAYDVLAWEHVRRMLPERGPVIDAGCGVGRWVTRLLGLGYEVIGIEQAPGMIDQARRAGYGPGFTLIEGSMETTELPEASAGMVLALGSLQYTADPAATLRRLAGWVRPGGTVVVLVDSLVALVIELLRAGRAIEAVERLRTRVGCWTVAGHGAEMHLLDTARLRQAFEGAGLRDVEVSGLLQAAATLGRERLDQQLAHDWDGHLELERELSAHPVLADTGKQLLASGTKR
ncbi:MAG TPA: class I SAM-dependent methyltransferase [Streptosporangiaceae bacterium]|jgi:SAM-dependent methyltransferase